jgi:ABC-type antimicrobial peptide transport system permease subunit
MVINYFKRAWRNIRKNKVSSVINIGGLAIGIAISMLIGLWIWDELSFNRYHQNYKRIAQVMQRQTFSSQIQTDKAIPVPLAGALRNEYGEDFKYIVLSSWTNQHLLSVNDKNLLKSGNFMQPDAAGMLTLKMNKGSRLGLKNDASIFLSQSLSKAFFGDKNPIGSTINIDGKSMATITGVYEDLPYNSSFRDVSFIASWQLYASADEDVKSASVDWGNNGYQLFVQISDNEEVSGVSAKIKNIKQDKIRKEDANSLKPEIFLHPMNRWYLYSDFVNGVSVGGRVQYIWMFGIIGFFVLLLACINFMNLSTARSEKRAKEIGILKSIGSLRTQLIQRFYCESLLISFLAFMLALVLIQLLLPFFNFIADKQIAVLWQNPLFWLIGVGFILITGVIAGSYPAFYLSSFQPVSVLKGTFKAGRFAAIPRKALVVLQFTVSTILIISTIVVFRQIQFAKHRSIGYSRDKLILLRIYTLDLYNHFDAVRNDLLQTGLITDVAGSLNSITNLGRQTSGFDWKGKTPDKSDMFAVVGVTPEFGKTIDWQVMAGRDFSRSFLTDSAGLILNEAAVKYMGLKNPVGEVVTWNKKYTILGVVKDIVVASPFEPVKQAIYYIDPEPGGVLNIKVRPDVNFNQAISKIEAICKKYGPSAPFDYKVVDEEYGKKFNEQQRIGNLASSFSLFAILISSLGVFGLALFVAEQRTKEIGVRKVLGASVFSLWRLLSKEFVGLVFISSLIAAPVAYYFMYRWLQSYSYRVDIPWWILAGAGAAVLLVTLLTVSYQSIKAASKNPVKSLRTE